MKEKKSAATLWAAQSDATRIATGTAFAMAVAFILYYFSVNLPNIHATLYRVFETRGQAYEVFATLAIAIIIATQLIVAMLCSVARRKLEQGQDVENVENVGTIVATVAVLALTVLGFGVSIMLFEMPKSLTPVEFTPLFLLTLLNFFVTFILICLSIYVFTNEQSDLPDNPISVVGVITTGLSVAFLALGFSGLNVSLWAAAMVLTLMLRPVGEAFDETRQMKDVTVIGDGDNKPASQVIEMGV